MSVRKQFRQAMSDLAGRGARRVIEALRSQVRIARSAVDVADGAVAGHVDLDVARSRIGELEGEGDRYRAELVTALERTLIIPIDREDLFRLSRSVDDVLDNLRDFARELDLFGPEVRSPMFEPVLGAIGAALDEFDDAIAQLAVDTTAAVEGSLRTKKRGNEVRRHYQHAVAELLDDEVTGVTLKRRELLRRLDLVGLSLGEASDALADGGLKRGT